MNEDEAKKVIKILLEADGGFCEFCASDLIEIFIKQFPKFEKLAKKMFERKFEESLEEFRKIHG